MRVKNNSDQLMTPFSIGCKQEHTHIYVHLHTSTMCVIHTLINRDTEHKQTQKSTCVRNNSDQLNIPFRLDRDPFYLMI